MGLLLTLALLAASLSGFGFATWMAAKPPQPLKVRMVNYHVVQILMVVVMLVMLAHMVTLVTGRTPQ